MCLFQHVTRYICCYSVESKIIPHFISRHLAVMILRCHFQMCKCYLLIVNLWYYMLYDFYLEVFEMCQWCRPLHYHYTLHLTNVSIHHFLIYKVLKQLKAIFLLEEIQVWLWLMAEDILTLLCRAPWSPAGLWSLEARRVPTWPLFYRSWFESG